MGPLQRRLKQEEPFHEGSTAVPLPVLLWYTAGSTRPGCSHAAAGAAAADSSRSRHLSPLPPGCCRTDWRTNTSSYIREELKFGGFFALWKRTGDTKDNWADNNCRLNSWYARRDEMLKPLTILSFCSPTRSQALCVEALLSRRVWELYNAGRGKTVKTTA